MWYKHPAINLSWLTERLYGNRSQSNTSKFYKKIKGEKGQRLLDHERSQLEEIRKELLKDLEN